MNLLLRRPFLLFHNKGPFLRRGIEEFFDNITKPGETPLAGRAWKPKELRLKSLSDLHKLWFVLLKERNKLLTEKAHVEVGKQMLNPARINKVRESMRGIKIVIGERMRLKKAENKLNHTQDPKELQALQTEINKLRILTGTPAIPLPPEEVPYEEKKELVPRPPTARWWQNKVDAKKAARAERKKFREDPEEDKKQQAIWRQEALQRMVDSKKATEINKQHKLKNKKKREKERIIKNRVPQKAHRQKRVKTNAIIARAQYASKK